MCSSKDYQLSADTSPEAEAFLFEQLAKKSAAQKLEMIGQASATMRTLAMIGLRERNAEATEQELKIRLVESWYGAALASEAAERLTSVKSMNDDQIEATLLVVTALEKLEIKYFIIGSLASGIYGEPRAANDVDLLADIRREHVEPLCEILQSDFHITRVAIEEALAHRSSYSAIHLPSLFKVDMLLPTNRAFDEQQIHRRVQHVVAHDPERSAFVASPEDVILAKLEWCRLGNGVSEQHWRDITGIFKASQGRLDIGYMKNTANQLDVLDLLRRLLPEQC
jgi:hypothetical protein